MFNWKTPYNALQSILQRWKMRREINAELKFHLDLLTEENIDSGMSPEAARQAALRRFGNLNDVNEVCLEIKTSEAVLWLEDFTTAVKSCGEKPWFTFLSVLSLSLGIAAAIAIFSLINNILWQPISDRSSDKIVVVQETNSFGNEVDTSNLNFLDLRARNHTLEYVAAFSTGTRTAIGDTESSRSTVSWISDDFFSVLDAEPFLGRVLNSADQQPISNPAAMVSYRFWQHQLNSDGNLSGKKINVDGRDYSIAGVLPPEINFSTETDVWIPRGLFDDSSERSAHNLKVIARVRGEFSLTQVQTDLSSIQRRLAEEYPESNAGQSVKAAPLREHLTADVRPLLLTFLAGIGLVLCIAGINVTNLLLIRDESRHREVASKIRLGANRSRIFRRIIIESLLLSLLSTFFGILLSAPIAGIIFDFIADTVPEIKEIKINGVAFIFAVGLSIIIGLLCGLLPALKLSQSDSADSSAEKEKSNRYHLSNLGDLAVTAELALTMILLLSAGLLIQNFWDLSKTNPGFDPERVLTVQLSLPSDNYQKEQDKINFYRCILRKINSIPAVESAGLINNLPLNGENINGTFYAEENPERKNYSGFRIISPKYFQSLSIPLIKGRFFAEQDDENSTPVAIISENLVKKLSPGKNPLGQRINFSGMDSKNDTWMVIVGVAGQVRHNGLEFRPESDVYVPYSQRPFRTRDMSVAIKTAGDSEALIAAVRNEIKATDANLPLKFETMNEIFLRSLARQRYQTTSFIFFAFFALVLSVTGFYIVMKYSVANRINGARKNRFLYQRDVISYSVKKGSALAVIGTILGSAAIIVVFYSIPELLFGLRKVEPAIFAAASTFIFSLTAIISYLTARSSHWR